MSSYNLKSKAISVRVDPLKYDRVMAYLKNNKYKIYPIMSVGTILDDALDEFIKKNKVPETKPIKGQTKIHFENIDMYIQDE